MSRRGNFKILGSWDHYVPGVADLIVLFLMFLLGAIVGNVVSLLIVKFLGPEAGQEYGTLIAYPLMFLPPMVYSATLSRMGNLFKEGVRLDSSHFGEKGGLVCALVASAGVLAAGFCADSVNSLLPEMPEWLENVLKSLTQGKIWISLLCVSVMAPFCEEWLCRGMVMRGLLRNGTKPFWAIVISALVFAIIHLNPWQAVPAFIFGCFFGYVYYKSGSLRLTMLMHCVNNTFAVILSHIEPLKDLDNWQDVMSPANYWSVLVACAVVVFLTVKVFSRIPQENPKGNFDSAELD